MKDYPESTMVDGIKYVREDSVQSVEPCALDIMNYAIVRSRYQGVMSGYVERIEGQTVILHKARQLYSWNSKFVLIELATKGLNNAENCRFSCENAQPVVMTEACGVIYCTPTAAQSLRNHEGEEY